MSARIVARFAGLIVYEETAALTYATAHAEVCRFVKLPVPPPQPDPGHGSASHFDDLKAALNDPLAEQLLAAAEPGFATVAALLPPLRDVAFLGDEASPERLEVTPDGAISGRDDLPAPEGKLLAAGLLAGWLPALVHQYETTSGPAELLQFATLNATGGLHLWRRLKRGTGCGSTFAYTRDTEAVAAEDFYARLLALWERWNRFRQDGLRLELPEPDLQSAAQGMLTLGVLTFRDLLPRYGVGCYGGVEHNSFPPSLTFLVQSLLAWGHLDRARDLLAHYLSRYVKPDGTLDYYGPAVAEYGQLLALIADYVRIATETQWLADRATLLRPLWQRLLALRAESLRRYPVGDPHHGLIPGLPEADYHHLDKEWDTFYYSGDVWACRGLREIGLALQQLSDPGLHAEGHALVAEAEAYRQDILASVTSAVASAVGGDGFNPLPEKGGQLKPSPPAPTGVYVPPGPDQTTPIERLTADTHASYCNYRYLLEMLSAGVLPGEWVAAVAAWRRAHGGELLAGTRFGDQLDNWPALHYARGLLETDDVDHYLLLLYSHWAHHCAQGTLSSYEQVRIEPDETGTRRMVAGQVVPCQVMVPTMLRWGLVYEERDADVLWFCRAIPRRWLSADQKLAVRKVPTRFGKVGFTLKTTSATAAKITLHLPNEPVQAEIILRLRHPQGLTLSEARLDGKPVVLEADKLHLPAGLAGKVKLVVRWG